MSRINARNNLDVEEVVTSKHILNNEVIEVDIVVVSSLDKWRERPESKQYGWNVRQMNKVVIAARLVG